MRQYIFDSLSVLISTLLYRYLIVVYSLVAGCFKLILIEAHPIIIHVIVIIIVFIVVIFSFIRIVSFQFLLHLILQLFGQLVFFLTILFHFDGMHRNGTSLLQKFTSTIFAFILEITLCRTGYQLSD